MENNKDIYYIVIQNRSYRQEYGNNDYHLERVFSREEIIKIIDKEVLDNFDHSYFIIVTNDKTFLNKYLFTINIDELKIICDINDYNKKNIRINPSFYFDFKYMNFIYFQKILDNEIITASMHWIRKTDYPYEDKSIGVTDVTFNGWIENKEFVYFKTPLRYRNDINEDSVFSFRDYSKGNIETFKKMVNINILEIGTDYYSPYLNWRYNNGLLKYYDKISCTRLYIQENLFQSLKDDNNINFHVETKLDKNLYIEYYVTGIELPKEYNDDNSDLECDDESGYSYDKYNGAYGYDDNTIDDAFEGNPENYWNID